MIATLTEFERFGQLAYYPLAGGDKASKEAIRPILGLLGGQADEHAEFLASIEPDRDKIRLICEQIERGLNTVATSSLGRLFDAAADTGGTGSEEPVRGRAADGAGGDD